MRPAPLVAGRLNDRRVSNAYSDRVTISIHVYGADIGTVERATYNAAGTAKPFVSGYADLSALI